ncbi:EAL domain-containing protein, partial [Siculibacillus lacustris]
MQRFADIFIAICLPIAAASAGVVAYFQFEASGRMAIAFAGLALVALILVRLDGLRRRARRETETRLAAMDRLLKVFGGDLEAVERRLAALEDGQPRRSRDELDQVIAEIEVIGTLTRQVIETVADLEIAVAEGRSTAGTTARQAAAPAVKAAPPERVPRPGAAAFVPDRFDHLDPDGFLDLVRRAIDADRIELLLQPIVTLPQRKARFYEALARLRAEDGEVIHPSDYIPLAESRGFIAALDEQILLKSVNILRRLTARSKDVGVFLNLSGASLGHADFFRDFVQVMEKNRDLCEMLVFEFTQASVRSLGPIELEGLRALAGLGFHFSVDQITDLKISFQNLADLGFRYVKISADRLLHRPDELATDIHPADLSDYFQRFGMELIADRIEREADVVDVLDFGIRLGQGFLFSPPRPVRLDVLQTPAARAAEPSRAEAEAAAPTPAMRSLVAGPSPVPSPAPRPPSLPDVAAAKP